MLVNSGCCSYAGYAWYVLKYPQNHQMGQSPKYPELSLFAPHSEDNQTAAAEPQHAAVGHLIGFSMTLGIFQSVASIVFYLCSSENGDFDVDCQDWFLRRTSSANPMMTYA